MLRGRGVLSMNNDENIVEQVSRTLAYIGGAGFFSDLLLLFAKKLYRCPCCGSEVKGEIRACPICKATLLWNL